MATIGEAVHVWVQEMGTFCTFLNFAVNPELLLKKIVLVKKPNSYLSSQLIIILSYWAVVKT